MPYRDQATVQSWVADFLRGHEDVAPDIAVLEQYYTEGPESGLVVVQLKNATTVTSLQPVIRDGVATWRVHFDAREESLDLDWLEVGKLAGELRLVSMLCQYLQERTENQRDSAQAS